MNKLGAACVAAMSLCASGASAVTVTLGSGWQEGYVPYDGAYSYQISFLPPFSEEVTLELTAVDPDTVFTIYAAGGGYPIGQTGYYSIPPIGDNTAGPYGEVAGPAFLNAAFSHADLPYAPGFTDVEDVFLTTDHAASFGYRLDLTPAAPTVPEPATWGLMLLGFALVGSMARRHGVNPLPSFH